MRAARLEAGKAEERSGAADRAAGIAASAAKDKARRNGGTEQGLDQLIVCSGMGHSPSVHNALRGGPPVPGRLQILSICSHIAAGMRPRPWVGP